MRGPVLSPLVTAVLTRRFPAIDHAALAELLQNNCGSNLPLAKDESLIERIRLAVLRLSDGHPAAVLDHMGAAQVDWRDVLVAAGFGSDLRAHVAWASGATRS